MVYSVEQRKFIDECSIRLPGLADNFGRAIAIDPRNRLMWAKKELKRVYRDGWHTGAEIGWHPVIDLKDAETTDQHVHDLKSQAQKYFSSPICEEIEAIIDVHDDVEAVANCLLPTSKGNYLHRDINLFRGLVLGSEALGVVSRDVKSRIEEIGSTIIFENEPQIRALWLDYEDKGSEAAQIASSLDKIAPMTKCIEYLNKGMKPEDFNAYWKHWTPERAKQELHPCVSDIYADEILPEIKETILNIDPEFL